MKIIPTIAIMLTLTGCTVPYRMLKHNDMPYHTKGMYSIFKSIGRLIRKQYSDKAAESRSPVIVNSTMPASEFIDTSAAYLNQLVSYSARIETDNTDMIRIIWDYNSLHFGAAVPVPMLFPYPQNAYYTNARYYIKFIPISDFQKIKPAHVWDNSKLLTGIKFKNVIYLSRGSMEKPGGFIDKNYHELY